MNTLKIKNNTLAHKIVSLLVVFIFIFTPISHTFELQKVEALDAGGSWATVGQMEWKEIADAIVWALMSALLQQITVNIIDWINNGFEGNPSFVTNFDDLLLQAADREVGNLIYGSALKDLCSPFALDVKLAIISNYENDRDFRAQCTATEVVNNLDGFLGGDFNSGGWDGWFEVTQNPNNNPYGAFGLAQAQLDVKITGAQAIDDKKIKIGKGFLSVETCEPLLGPPGVGSSDEEYCKIVTPGVAVEERLQTALNLPTDRITVADEIDEILGAVFAQLAYKILESGEGLLGSSNSGGYTQDIRDYDPTKANGDKNDPNYTAGWFDKDAVQQTLNGEAGALETEETIKCNEELTECTSNSVTTYNGDTPEITYECTGENIRCLYNDDGTLDRVVIITETTPPSRSSSGSGGGNNSNGFGSSGSFGKLLNPLSGGGSGGSGSGGGSNNSSNSSALNPTSLIEKTLNPFGGG